MVPDWMKAQDNYVPPKKVGTFAVKTIAAVAEMTGWLRFQQGKERKYAPPALLKLLLVLGVVLTGVAALIAGPVARLFVGYDATLTALTIHATRCYAPDFLLIGLSLFVSAWFTGLGNGPVSAAVSFSRTFLFELGCVFLLPALFGADGIWFSAFVADVLALLLGAALLVRFRSRYGY